MVMGKHHDPCTCCWSGHPRVDCWPDHCLSLGCWNPRKPAHQMNQLRLSKTIPRVCRRNHLNVGRLVDKYLQWGWVCCRFKWIYSNQCWNSCGFHLILTRQTWNWSRRMIAKLLPLAGWWLWWSMWWDIIQYCGRGMFLGNPWRPVCFLRSCRVEVLPCRQQTSCWNYRESWWVLHWHFGPVHDFLLISNQKRVENVSPAEIQCKTIWPKWLCSLQWVWVKFWW